MPISRFGVNTKLGNQKYDHKRQFVFTGGISTKQNKAIDNKIKSRTLNVPFKLTKNIGVAFIMTGEGYDIYRPNYT